jgi:hypothetical protein
MTEMSNHIKQPKESDYESEQNVPKPPPSDSQWNQRRWSFNDRRIAADDPRRKNPHFAAFLSLVPGLGQIYTGHYQQGFVNVVVIGALISLLVAGVGPLQPLAAFFLVFYWLYNVIDAYRRASLYNHVLAGLGPLEIPEEPEPTDARGSLLGGILLAGFGLVALAHTLLDLRVDWIEDWWPIVLVLLGAFLIFQSVHTGKKAKK